MINAYCENVKRGSIDLGDFAALLQHVEGCDDCIRRIENQIAIRFNQRDKGDK